MALQSIEVRQGTDWDRTITLRDELGDVITSYLGTDTLEAKVWPGDDQGVLFLPQAEWEGGDAGTGRVLVWGSRQDVSALTPGTYYLLITVTRADRTKEAYSSYFVVTPGPGLAAPLRAYCTIDDLRDEYEDVDSLQTRRNQAGFADVRAKTRKDVDSVVLSCYRGDRLWLRDILDGGGLVKTTDVVKLATLWSLASILGAKLPDAATVAAGRSSAHQQAAARFERRANALAKSLVAEIDIDGDGIADITVNCAEVNSRVG